MSLMNAGRLWGMQMAAIYYSAILMFVQTNTINVQITIAYHWGTYAIQFGIAHRALMRWAARIITVQGYSNAISLWLA